MIDTKIVRKARGRPRSFDLEAALTKAEALFHQHGYDGVGIAALVDALGINPPSFYAAFGSKAGLFERVLERYARAALPLDAILVPGRPVAEALTDLLETAARIYSAEPAARGCLVLETPCSGSGDAAGAAAAPYRDASHARIRDFVAMTAPDQSERLADLIDVLLSGLSARAREGWDTDRLVAAAQASALAIPAALNQ